MPFAQLFLLCFSLHIIRLLEAFIREFVFLKTSSLFKVTGFFRFYSKLHSLCYYLIL